MTSLQGSPAKHKQSKTGSAAADSLNRLELLQLKAALLLGIRENERFALEPKPQEGPQVTFLAHDADIAIYGGSAGSGKSMGLLMYPLKYIGNPFMRAVLFRRTTPELTNPGGLWDESRGVYAYLRPHSIGGNILEHHFPSGAYVKMAHLQYEDTCHDWDSSQIPIIIFDQLEQFTRHQFFYMASRNRSMSGVPARIRAACNPDADSWLAEFIEWWIDQDTGYPLPGRSGLVRWFVRDGDNIVWGDTREELAERFGEDSHPTSITFIAATIHDNKMLLRNNPQYLARLKALPMVERERLLGGNWKIKPSAGLMFQRHWCPTLEAEPDNVDWVRGWDLAATKPSEQNSNPDWTVGVRLGKYRDANRFVIAPDVRRDRISPAGVEKMVLNTAQADGTGVKIRIPQDPGQAGKAQAATYVGKLTGYRVTTGPVTGDKITRFGPLAHKRKQAMLIWCAAYPMRF